MSQDLLASVIKDEPTWDSIEPAAQPLLRKCLAKDDPKQRLRDIGDAGLLLRASADAPGIVVRYRQGRPFPGPGPAGARDDAFHDGGVQLAGGLE